LVKSAVTAGESLVIIRSGLIKNHDNVDFDEFSKHWRDVHGPLARIVPRMRAYSQNHIKKTLTSGERFGFHRVDGISQLRFDTLADMTAAMDSPEQRACVVDIQGFLSSATILIQEEAKLYGNAARRETKLMYLLRDDNGVAPLLDAVSETLSSLGGSFRFNHVINRDFRVDSTVPAGAQMIDGVLEVFLPGWMTGERFNESQAIERSRSSVVIGAYEVSEYVVLPLRG